MVWLFSGIESTVICPLVGETSPATIRKIVVLPQPLGPSRTTTSPGSMERSSGWTTVVPLKAFDTSLNSSMCTIHEPPYVHDGRCRGI